jgi:hypothetical protein
MDQLATALNAICPYYTMFPLAFPLGVLKRRGQPKQWVLDPFCGRGTTTFAARLLGLPSVSLDSNPRRQLWQPRNSRAYLRVR